MLTTLLVAGCGGEASTVTTPSVADGTYEGSITAITLSERTLTVGTPEGDTLRAFFTDSTRVMDDSLEVGFGSLVAGEQVRVAVQQASNQLNTTHIEVLEPQDDVLEP
jgi:tRNA G37 N-methylase TrmD